MHGSAAAYRGPLITPADGREIWIRTLLLKQDATVLRGHDSRRPQKNNDLCGGAFGLPEIVCRQLDRYCSNVLRPDSPIKVVGSDTGLGAPGGAVTPTVAAGEHAAGAAARTGLNCERGILILRVQESTTDTRPADGM